MVEEQTGGKWLRELRTLLVLGRVSNLPTVWSNCLAGWLLSGGGTFKRFILLCVGSSCLYIAGMYLNDAFDAEFDLQHRSERPIPSGAISLSMVWGWGLGWLGAGLLLLSLLNWTSLLLALVLAGMIVLYDAVHKAITLSPLLMAGCRFLLYLLASSAAVRGLSGLAVWSGLALAAYVVGLSYLARGERVWAAARYWPCWLLAAPIALAALVNSGEFRVRAWLLSGIVTVWIIRCLAETFWASTASLGRTVSGLLAGICLVDLLAINGMPTGAAVALLLLFVLALLCQRFIPAT